MGGGEFETPKCHGDDVFRFRLLIYLRKAREWSDIHDDDQEGRNGRNELRSDAAWQHPVLAVGGDSGGQ